MTTLENWNHSAESHPQVIAHPTSIDDVVRVVRDRSGPHPSPVRAAGNGVVAYAGNELPGFGNLVLIRHGDGWMSAYAHNDTILVNRGDKVTRGQTIARVGSTGNVSEPQLHFEIRQNLKAVDPKAFLDGR